MTENTPLHEALTRLAASMHVVQLEKLKEQLFFARDDDYHYDQMSEEEFAEHIRESTFAQWPSNFYCEKRIRQIGQEAFQRETTQLLRDTATTEDLMYLVWDYNYDDGEWSLKQILMHPTCDLQAARIVYWGCEADVFYEQYGSLQKAREFALADKRWALETIELLLLIEQKLADGLFLTKIPHISMPRHYRWSPKYKPDFSTPPLSQIPPPLLP